MEARRLRACRFGGHSLAFLSLTGDGNGQAQDTKEAGKGQKGQTREEGPKADRAQKEDPGQESAQDEIRRPTVRAQSAAAHPAPDAAASCGAQRQADAARQRAQPLRQGPRPQRRQLSAADAHRLPGARGQGIPRAHRDHPRQDAHAVFRVLHARAQARIEPRAARHQARRHGGGHAGQHAGACWKPITACR